MKLFKRSAKDTIDPSPAQPPAGTRRHGPDLNGLIPGAIASVLGLLGGAAMLWFALFYTAQTQQQSELREAWGGSQAAALQQAIKQLSADTLAAARNPQLLSAVQSQDPALIRSAERNLAYWDGVVDAQLNARGQAVQDSNRAAPMNFAALDMLRRVEGGQIPAPEAYKVGQRWLVYSAAPLRLSDQEAPEVTLLLVVDLQRLLRALPAMAADTGQLQLVQQFGSAPAQVLEQRGLADSGRLGSIAAAAVIGHIGPRPGLSLAQMLYLAD